MDRDDTGDAQESDGIRRGARIHGVVTPDRQKCHVGIVSPADQPHNNLADIGAIFDDATTMMIGGISPAANKAPVIAVLARVGA